MERGENTVLEVGDFLERRWFASVIETWVWLVIDCWMSISVFGSKIGKDGIDG